MMGKINRLILLTLLGSIALLSADYSYAEEREQEIPETYFIKKGDTLWDISKEFLKDPFQWPGIWKNNDYIANPDLIYPGNKLQLRKMLQKAIQVKEEIKKIKVIKRKKRVAKPPAPELPKKIPVTNVSIFRTAGFIARAKEYIPAGNIIGSPLDRSTLSKGDKVYTDIGPGKNRAIGKKYSIYRIIKEVRHPITKKEMGILIKIVGTLEIKEFKEDRSVALITASYEEIARYDLITDRINLEIPIIDPSLPRQIKDIRGFIVATKSDRQSVGLRDIVYLDTGKNRGVVPGDRFTAYKTKEETSGTFTKKVVFQYPEIPIGELKIIDTKDETATALVIKSVQELDIGEKVKYKLPEKKK